MEDDPFGDTLFVVSDNGILDDNKFFPNGVIQRWCDATGVKFAHLMGSGVNRLVFPSATARVHFKLKFDF